ncbi:DUF2975 domain-containing protein [Bifidobacterium pullorum]|uniref:DUF2975 domain-containing protein n=1 Tax=Bifidobacterium pullorum TaxID=78448 RepID=UPI00195A51D2|nr:DUF2975 domain-containing protein [Bifidobacterium pullorum]
MSRQGISIGDRGRGGSGGRGPRGKRETSVTQKAASTIWVRVDSAAAAIARIAEVVMWLGAAAVVGTMLWALAAQVEPVVDADANLLRVGPASLSGSFLGVTVWLGHGALRGAVSPPVIALVTVAQLAIAAGWAMVFHEVAGLCGRLQAWERRAAAGGRALVDEGSAGPFVASAVRGLRRIGALLIAMPVVAWAVGLVCMAMRASVDFGLDGVAFVAMVGLIGLAIAHVFEYGMGLQRDVDGLL